MTRFSLALSAFRRHVGRTVFTVLSVATAFAIFTVLAAINQGLNGHISLAAAQRLDTTTAINAPLPVSYAQFIRSIPGVDAVAGQSVFEGYFRDPTNDIGVLAFSVPQIFELYPEFELGNSERSTFLRDKQGAIVGDALAQLMQWRVGETVPLQNGPVQTNGSTVWTFHIDGIYHTELPGLRHAFIIHYDYFNDGLAPSPIKDTVRLFAVMVRSPSDMVRVAHAIDSHFANASPDTRTMSEQQETMSAMRQFGDINAIIVAVGLAVFASMLLITGNTMANSVRERLVEFAMMRALGFGRLQLALIVLRESAILVGAGAVLGVLAGWGVSRLMVSVMTLVLRGFTVTWATVALAAFFALLFALVTGLLPGWRVADMPVAATLRRT